jgi:hypothetical protein
LEAGHGGSGLEYPIWGIEAGRWRVQRKPGLHCKTLPPKKTKVLELVEDLFRFRDTNSTYKK